MMRECGKFYIDGAWVSPAGPNTVDVVDPCTGAVSGRLAMGSLEDVNRAVAAAKRAFPAFSRTSRQERLALLGRIVAGLEARYGEMTAAIRDELGAPEWLARDLQAAVGMAHLKVAMGVLQDYAFDEWRGSTLITREPIGVCALITPWNWPLNQIVAKVAPALATGCTMVLKPAQLAPYSAQVFTEILHEAGVPAGVFNLVQGAGSVIGAALAEHADVDMVSFTGSTQAGIDVARRAAGTVKRVCQELGGKSANIVLEDADLEAAVVGAVKGAMLNTGQTCSALTRLLVPHSRMAEASRIAAAAAGAISVGPPGGNHQMGPLISEAQWRTVQGYIQLGLDEGATLVAGGLGRPAGGETGSFAKPTVFADVTPEMTIAREEIFGPVLSILGYGSVDEAIAIANDTPFGLSGGVQGVDPVQVARVARALCTGQVYVNGAGVDFTAPFGGVKQSGNGREWGDHAFAEYLETKAIIGAPTAA